jgi:hypothetical protein
MKRTLKDAAIIDPGGSSYRWLSCGVAIEVQEKWMALPRILTELQENRTKVLGDTTIPVVRVVPPNTM